MCAEVKIDVALVTEKLLATRSARNFGGQYSETEVLQLGWMSNG